MNSKEKLSLSRVFILGGALSVYLIGGATATGQEAMQFFTSHGFKGIGALIITLLLFGWASSSLIMLGYDTKGTSQSVYKYYFGDKIGTIVEWFVTLFLYGLVITAISGGGSIISEFYGISKFFGASVMAVLVFITVLLSLNKIVDILGVVAPIIIVFTAIISIISITNNVDQLQNATQLLSEFDVMQAVSSWWLSGILYGSLGITIAAPFLIRMGSITNNRREALLGGLTGTAMYALTIGLISLALLASISDVYNIETPLVMIAKDIGVIFSVIFSIVIFSGIYTTAAPMFWYVCERLAVEGTKRYIWTASLLIIFAYFGGLTLPFGKLINILFPLTGLLGMFLIIAMVIHQVKNRGIKSKS